MNSNPRSSNPLAGSTSSDNFQFDFGLTSNSRSSATSLNGQRNVQQTPAYPFPSLQQPPLSRPVSSSSPWNQSKPSWTHQPSPTLAPRSSSLSNPTSMVGDIFGKSWTSAAPSSQSVRLSVSESNPYLFRDLLGTALRQSQNSNAPLENPAPSAPLKNSAPSAPLKNAAPSAPLKNVTSSAPLKNAASSAPPRPNSFGEGFVPYSLPTYKDSVPNKFWDKPHFTPVGQTGRVGGTNLGGPAMKTGSTPITSNYFHFTDLKDFGSNPSPSPVNKTDSTSDNSFGAFQDASKPVGGAPTYSSNPSPPVNNSSSPNSSTFSGIDDFGGFSSSQAQAPQAKSADPLDMLFSSSSSAPAASSNQSASQEFTGGDDWGLDSEFGGHDSGGTTELEGLPPPPAGVTAITAKTKGMDNYKQGQFADAIKWLSWATVLLEKSSDIAANFEVLSCRASCYKEVGEYKKAIADCTKVLESDSQNVTVLLQRALLYESSEKYKLGAEDLRAVLKIDPTNRLAKGTIHRVPALCNVYQTRVNHGDKQTRETHFWGLELKGHVRDELVENSK
ncbi:hypothetical protein H6P81_003939 [Aristolochia fimbriata]|uniref:Uncharacterized protein n=1 Tax=Aristolochia fimbriata TaxID=158543 RepID=A0AAV7FGW8_ARIFI|nr:hypothetical protein H6P81_003939 [Aristolochia fimbriata]